MISSLEPDCKVCFVRREYSVIALFMRGRGLRGYAEHGVDYSITCTAASKICVCVAKNLGNCAESLNSRQNCPGNLFPAQTELYSLALER